MEYNIISLSLDMLKSYTLCDHCLGRQFAQLLTNTTNEERGKNIRYVCAMHIDTHDKYEDSTGNYKRFSFRNVSIKSADNQECFLCNNIFSKVEEIAKNIAKLLEGYEFTTFLVGVVPTKEMVVKEEQFWEEYGAEYAERIKEELSREIGKALSRIINKDVDFHNADITIIVDLRKNTISKKVRSLYIYGRYNKYTEMPQTKWVCGFCKGIGCEKCNYTGKKYEESVEELIGEVLLNHTKGVGTSFHGAGREDIDALCYGFREFVIEIHEPKIRTLDLRSIEKEINEKYKGKIEVSDLEIVDKKKVKEIKSKRDNKIYEVVITCKDALSKEDIHHLNNIKDLYINQQTPKRVEHRRADKVRRRKIFYVKVKNTSGNEATLEIKAEAGTYIKEFVHGDEGRTRPSISSMLEKKCDVKKLVVVGFEPNNGKKE